MRKLIALSMTLIFALLFSCKKQPVLVDPMPTNSVLEQDNGFNVPFTTFTLENGLQVIFHIDRSDPVVAVALTSHVGSAREKEGRTGFAHLFEHLLFLESENLGKGGLDAMSARIGGSGANGSTSRDRTNYYQTVPNDALEKMIWAEADKLGYFINTVTEDVLAKEKEVVKNEKRQGVDNNPYGHGQYVIDKNLYPVGHPYSWQVIGSLEDLQNAELQDVKDFFNAWYVPNNCTLVIAGDFNEAEARSHVEKYFNEIPSGDEIARQDKVSAVLEADKRLFHEDNFARLPELTMAYPAAHIYHPDSYALEVLQDYLAYGKSAPLYQVLVEEQQLTDGVDFYSYNSELAGQSQLSVRAFEGVELDKVNEAIQMAFDRFEQEGIPLKDLQRIKAGQETGFYNSLSSVLGKAFQLAQYQIFADDPAYISEDVRRILDVSADDVMRVYNKYIKDKPAVITSFVPLGAEELALSGSVRAEVQEEDIVMGAEDAVDPNKEYTYEKTPSSFDRSVEPAYGKASSATMPEIWRLTTDNGMQVIGIENNEVPLVQFNLTIPGGMLHEDMALTGVSNMLGDLMNLGTANKTPAQLEAAIELLGASIAISAGSEEITIRGNTLARNFGPTMALVEEMLLEPRWDEKEFDLLKQSTLSTLQQQQSSPGRIASVVFNKLIYGDNHILSMNSLGTEESVKAITMDDLKSYYANYFSPSIASFKVVGATNKGSVAQALNGIAEKWAAKSVSVPSFELPNRPEQSQVYFYDVPGAKQSVVNFGAQGISSKDDDSFLADLMNYRLGGGGFASQLTQELRENKGYTYGIGSGFGGYRNPGAFIIRSNIRSNVTTEGALAVKEILDNYAKNFNAEDLEVTKSYFTKSSARQLETLGAKLGMLSSIVDLGYDDDYLSQRQDVIKNLDIATIKRIANKYVNPDQMIYFVTGDADSQLELLEQLGYGKPTLIDKDGRPVTKVGN